jgi:hypothetical protein
MEAITSTILLLSYDWTIADPVRQIPGSPWLSQWDCYHRTLQREVSDNISPVRN